MDRNEVAKMLTRLQAAWLARQYRLTFRAALTGLLAAGVQGDEAIRQAHEITVAALQQYQKSEI